MNRRLLALVAGLAFLLSSPSPAGEQPVIASKIAGLIDAGNTDGARARYDELSRVEGLNMALEIKSLNTLLMTYIQTGKPAEAELVGNMAADLNQKIISDMMSRHSPQMAAQMQAMQEAQRQAEARQQANLQAAGDAQGRPEPHDRGESRDDLDRFKGLYSAPGGDVNKAIFVTVSCDGYLVTGPMWADVGPWWMRPTSPTKFTYSDSFTAFSLEFENGDKGRGRRIWHDIDGVESPVERSAELPGDWEACVERPRR